MPYYLLVPYHLWVCVAVGICQPIDAKSYGKMTNYEEVVGPRTMSDEDCRIATGIWQGDQEVICSLGRKP